MSKTTAAALSVRSPALLLIGFFLATWMVFYGVTHCGLTEYRISLEPFVLIAAAAALARLKRPGRST